MKTFFDKNEEGRYKFLMESIYKKIDLIDYMVERKKLDTDITLLRDDLQKVSNEILNFT